MARPVSTRTCSVEGCDRKHCAKGLCRLHYLREWDKTHPERRERYTKAHYERHRAELIAKSARYRAENPNYAAVRERSNAKRRADYRGPWDLAWAGHLRRRYGVTVEQHDELFSEQGGICGICNADLTIPGTKVCLDHCHDTGRVRGFLCNACNTGIGQLKDDPELLRRAIDWVTPPVAELRVA